VESLSMIWSSGIWYIWHKQFGLLFTEPLCRWDSNQLHRSAGHR